MNQMTIGNVKIIIQLCSSPQLYLQLIALVFWPAALLFRFSLTALISRRSRQLFFVKKLQKPTVCDLHSTKQDT